MDDLARVQERVAGLGSAIVAFSGGVDSSLVAAVAARALGPKALAITAVSPALATGELVGARDVAKAIGIAHATRSRPTRCTARATARTAPTAATTASPSSTTLSRASRREKGYAAVLSGANADDLGDWRPGLEAAREHGVVHPLIELPKARVRELAEALGVPSARKPASPCLASRIPYGTAVTPGVLLQIDRAERAVKALGFEELRVRHFGALGRLELPAGRAGARAPRRAAGGRAAARGVLRRLRARGRRAGAAAVRLAQRRPADHRHPRLNEPCRDIRARPEADRVPTGPQPGRPAP